LWRCNLRFSLKAIKNKQHYYRLFCYDAIILFWWDEGLNLDFVALIFKPIFPHDISTVMLKLIACYLLTRKQHHIPIRNWYDNGLGLLRYFFLEIGVPVPFNVHPLATEKLA